MRNQVLFEITKEHLQAGLKGVPVGYSATSYVDAEKGLFYVGRPIQDLATRSAEEVIYLLFFAEPGTKQQIDDFFSQFQEKKSLQEEFYAFLKNLPRNASFGQLFSQCLIFLSASEKKESYRQNCLNLIAKIPTLILAIQAHQKQLDPKVETTKDEGYFQTFVSSFYGQNVSSELREFLNVYFIFHLDEGGGYLPAFVSKCTSSAKQDVFQSLASGILALEALISQSNQAKAVALIQEFCQQVNKDSSIQALQAWLEKKEHLPGYGDASFKNVDTRISFLFQMAEKSSFSDKILKSTSVLKDFLQKNSQLQPTMAAIAPILFQALSPVKDLHALQVFQYFAFSIGCIIQVMYDRVQANDGLGTNIWNPVYLYKHRI